MAEKNIGFAANCCCPQPTSARFYRLGYYCADFLKYFENVLIYLDYGKEILSDNRSRNTRGIENKHKDVLHLQE
jgi:hypothetical protein